MNRDEILTIAEAHSDMTAGWIFNAVGIERFWRAAYEAGAAAEREKVALWMAEQGYATGHGDTTEDLLKELKWQAAEQQVAEQERKEC